MAQVTYPLRQSPFCIPNQAETRIACTPTNTPIDKTQVTYPLCQSSSRTPSSQPKARITCTAKSWCFPSRVRCEGSPLKKVTI
ncbi:hypothetical protein IAT38_003814 [Cryptococcus sp. DSM 104549]